MRQLENFVRPFYPYLKSSYSGNLDSFIAVCTLSSIDLLKKFVNSQVLEHISIVGRLFSENKGIDSIVKLCK